MKKENNDSKQASFLDLNIKINHNKFITSLYDKRDAFPFSIVRMPFKDSNMPSKIFYSSLGAEVLRIGRANNDNAAFFKSAKSIVDRMIKQGGSKLKITNTLKKIYGQHFTVFGKLCLSKSAFFISCFRATSET